MLLLFRWNGLRDYPGSGKYAMTLLIDRAWGCVEIARFITCDLSSVVWDIVDPYTVLIRIHWIGHAVT